LSKFGITENDIQKIAAGTSNKNNPVKLSSEEISGILLSAL
jgi:alcohol dehydrogenase class IV